MGSTSVYPHDHGRLPTPEAKDERTYQGMYGGIAIYCNPTLAPGVVELRNPAGEVLAVVHNVKQIDTRATKISG